MRHTRASQRKIPRTFYFSIDRWQLFFLVAGVLLICSMCFTLGLMVGYHLSSTELSRKLPPLKELRSRKGKEKPPSFYHSLVEEERHKAARKTKPRPSPKMPSQKTSSKTRKGYLVQVAAFRNKKSAQKMVKELQRLGYPARIEKAEVSGKVWYRVRIRGLKDRTEAQQVYTALRKLGHKPMIRAE